MSTILEKMKRFVAEDVKLEEVFEVDSVVDSIIKLLIAENILFKN